MNQRWRSHPETRWSGERGPARRMKPVEAEGVRAPGQLGGGGQAQQHAEKNALKAPGDGSCRAVWNTFN